MRRIVSVWLPRWPIDRLRRARADGRPGTGPETGKASPAPDEPFALTALEESAVRLTAVNEAAARAGLGSGMTLSDARALVPALATAPAEPEADARALEDLARWCTRYTPWTNVQGADGLWLDVTGSAHLFGGEAALLDDLGRRLARAGLAHGLGLAPTAGAAWAVARFAPGSIVPPGGVRAALAGLPVEALRLEPSEAVLLRRLGLKRIGQLFDLPRAPLARRFRSAEMALMTRLDQALGVRDEPLPPLAPPPAYRSAMAFAEPVQHLETLLAALDRLAHGLTGALDAAGVGALGLGLTLCRADGSVARFAIGARRPTRDPGHILRLFREKLDGFDAGFGIDHVSLEAHAAAPAPTVQATLDAEDSTTLGGSGADEGLARLIDRLSSRFGAAALTVAVPRQSHIPERAQSRVPALNAPAAGNGPAERPSRPFLLLDRPEPVEVMAEIPDGPPLRFRWRRVLHQVARAEGPERIAPEWWRRPQGAQPPPRDYYRVEDGAGRRFWLFRSGLYQEAGRDGPPRWYMHGFFA